ncbi:MAG: IS66 family insertion sequence element accessory protein TnpA [Phycisphaerae bacterium]
MAIQCTGKASYQLREGREFWALALELQRQSGLTMAAFCRREEHSDKAFGRWKRKLSLPLEPAAAPAVFAPVTVTDHVTGRLQLKRTPDDHWPSSTDDGSGDPCSLCGGGRCGDRPSRDRKAVVPP